MRFLMNFFGVQGILIKTFKLLSLKYFFITFYLQLSINSKQFFVLRRSHRCFTSVNFFVTHHHHHCHNYIHYPRKFCSSVFCSAWEIEFSVFVSFACVRDMLNAFRVLDRMMLNVFVFCQWLDLRLQDLDLLRERKLRFLWKYKKILICELYNIKI